MRLVKLPKGTFLKLKPLQEEFFELEAQKEMCVALSKDLIADSVVTTRNLVAHSLECVLRSFVAITQGDQLQITYDGRTWNFDVVGSFV